MITRQPPNGMPPDGFPAQGGNGAGRPGGFGGTGGNKLKERFLASAAFTSMYDDAYRDLYRKIYGNGTALNTVDGVLDVLSTVEGHDPQSVSTDGAELRALIQQRTEHLGADAVITAG